MSTLICEATMVRERETKRTIRFKEVDNGVMLDLADAKVGQVYLKKADLAAAGNPQTIYVRVEVAQ